MEKMIMVFYEDGVEVQDVRYNKKDVLEFLREQRKTCKTKVKVEYKEYYSKYKMKVDKDIIEVVFPYMYAKENNIYEDLLEKWAKNDRRGFILKLRVLGFILGVGAVSVLASKAHSEIVEKYGSVSEFLEEMQDEIKFYTTNISELRDISTLEDELRGHTGYGEIDGYHQTIEEHLNGYCYLDHADTYSEMDKAVLEYCDENGLGKKVYQNAMEKYEYLKEADLDSANDIDLKQVYKDEIIKTKKIGN